MVQSSNYKQFNRGTRILTEESGFASGMLWTGNNIDAAHLKTIVNCDYDDTTGFLKTRDAFISNDDNFIDLGSFSLSDDLRNYTLIGAYSICAVSLHLDGEIDETYSAHDLYLFAKPYKQSSHWEVQAPDIIALYVKSSEEYYVCPLTNVSEGVSFKSIILKQMFQLYDNSLYALTLTDERTWLTQFQVVYDEDAEVPYSFRYIGEAKTLEKFDNVTLLEATVTGFNAGRCNKIFDYETTVGKVSKTKIKGVTIYQDGVQIVSPRVGYDAELRVSFDLSNEDYGVCCVALFKLAETSTLDKPIWEFVADDHPVNYYDDPDNPDIGDWEFHAGCTLTLPIQCRSTENIYAIAFYSSYNPRREYDIYAEDVVDRLMPYVVTANDGSANIRLKHYDLTQVNGSCLWNNRLCVWGNQYSSNTLFVSEIDNFYYYPIPNNAVLFDANIINCISYKNTLLVFTANKIWRLAEDNSGVITQTVVLNDISLSIEDSAQLHAIKNMVLFKSGNYYYMVVPKSQSLTDELTIAPIYKNISGLLNNLDKGALEVLQFMYPERDLLQCTVSSSPTDVYNEQDTVFIVYDVVATGSGNSYTYKLFLNYNTNLRAWTLYVCDLMNQTLSAALLTSARKMSFIKVAEANKFTIVVQQHSDNIADGFRLLLDTGYRTLSTAMQKRFREVQLKLFSETENVTQFGTAFSLDGVFRRHYIKLQELVSADNVISLTPSLDINTFILEDTMPIQVDGSFDKGTGSNAIELSDWTLDFSHFKREAPVTVRVPVSGKGYSPRFIFMAPNVIDLYINEINWVYRIMHGR